MNRFSFWVACLVMVDIGLAAASDEKLLSIATRGGHYEQLQRQELFDPFEKATGISIFTMPYQGGVHIMRNKFAPDLLDMLEVDAIEACSLNLARHSSPDELAVAESDQNVTTEFLDNAFLPCGLAHSTYSTVIAYNEHAFSGVKPESIGALFNTELFPGKRALQKSPANLLEWGLLAEGVPAPQVYDLLSTERGVKLSLEKLDSIRDDIIWWDKPEEAVALLENGDVVMASGFNGLFFEAWLNAAPIVILWDGQIIDRSVWVLPDRSNEQSELALKFVQFATGSKRQAALAQRIPYGPTRSSALSRIGFYPDKSIKMKDQLPSAAHHMTGALYRDTNWYANTRAYRSHLFGDWLESR